MAVRARLVGKTLLMRGENLIFDVIFNLNKWHSLAIIT